MLGYATPWKHRHPTPDELHDLGNRQEGFWRSLLKTSSLQAWALEVMLEHGPMWQAYILSELATKTARQIVSSNQFSAFEPTRGSYVTEIQSFLTPMLKKDVSASRRQMTFRYALSIEGMRSGRESVDVPGIGQCRETLWHILGKDLRIMCNDVSLAVCLEGVPITLNEEQLAQIVAGMILTQMEHWTQPYGMATLEKAAKAVDWSVFRGEGSSFVLRCNRAPCPAFACMDGKIVAALDLVGNETKASVGGGLLGPFDLRAFQCAKTLLVARGGGIWDL